MVQCIENATLTNNGTVSLNLILVISYPNIGELIFVYSTQHRSRKRGKCTTYFPSHTEETVQGIGTAQAMTTTLTNKSVAAVNFYSLEGTIEGHVPIEVRENVGADNADNHMLGALPWHGMAFHEDAPEKPNLFAENAL